MKDNEKNSTNIQNQFVYIYSLDIGSIKNNKLYIRELNKTFDCALQHYAAAAVELRTDGYTVCSESLRQYCVIPTTAIHKYLLKKHNSYLYNLSDGYFYLHLYWKNTHYVIPPTFKESDDFHYYGRSSEKPYIKAIIIDDFIGKDRWEREYKNELLTCKYDHSNDFDLIPSRETSVF